MSLLQLPYLNLSSELNPSNSSVSSLVIRCWGQNSPGETQLRPIIYRDCKDAIAKIHMGDKALAPITFGRGSDAGFQVPYDWESGNCIVQIDVVAADVIEETSPASIFKRAWDIAVECVIKPPHLGGRGEIGDNDGLKVWLFGVDFRELVTPGVSNVFTDDIDDDT